MNLYILYWRRNLAGWCLVWWCVAGFGAKYILNKPKLTKQILFPAFFSPTGASCISVLVWAWAWVDWLPGSPLALWATLVWEGPPSSPDFSWAWSWFSSSLRCWGFTALSWPSSYLQNKCLYQTPSHSFHIKAARTRFSPTSITPPWVWQDRMVTESCLAVDLTAVPSVDVINPYCLKPSSCVRSRAFRTGMKMYWLLWNDVWTVCLICCLILTCTVIQSPSTPCICSNQSVLWVWVSTLIPLPIRPPLFMVFVGGFEHSPVWDCWRFVHISVLFISCSFGTVYESQLWGTDKTYFFHYLWKVMKNLTLWNCLNGILFIEYPIYIKNI